jgi:uncharacterized protein with PQ loop repeat
VTDVLAVVATVYGLLMAASPLLQIRRMRATRSSADFSVGYMSILCVGFVLWATYGIAISNPALVISNTGAVSFGLAAIAIALRLRRQREDAG